MNRLAFEESLRTGVYKAIYSRRDIRRQFKSDPIPDNVITRVLDAAHHAPSVGFMQPWNFIIIRDSMIRMRIKTSFQNEFERSAKLLSDRKRRAKYRSLKLEGILEAPLNICITCDRKRSGPFVIGRTAIVDTDIFSVCCAVQNLWLAARAEGLGVGWVSILSNDDLRIILGLPADIFPVAYLCIGYVTHFPDEPELKTAGWLPRIPLEELVFYEKWGRREKELNP